MPNHINVYISLATSMSKTGKFQLTPLVQSADRDRAASPCCALLGEYDGRIGVEYYILGWKSGEVVGVGFRGPWWFKLREYLISWARTIVPSRCSSLRVDSDSEPSSRQRKTQVEQLAWSLAVSELVVALSILKSGSSESWDWVP